MKHEQRREATECLDERAKARSLGPGNSAWAFAKEIAVGAPAEVSTGIR
jgi:hypothetical protein